MDCLLWSCFSTRSWSPVFWRWVAGGVDQVQAVRPRVSSGSSSAPGPSARGPHGSRGGSQVSNTQATCSADDRSESADQDQMTNNWQATNSKHMQHILLSIVFSCYDTAVNELRLFLSSSETSQRAKPRVEATWKARARQSSETICFCAH